MTFFRPKNPQSKLVVAGGGSHGNGGLPSSKGDTMEIKGQPPIIGEPTLTETQKGDK